MIRLALTALASLLPVRRRIVGDDGTPYLTRYTILHLPFDRKIYLHRFHRSDADSELHNHPWGRSYSLILIGGYREERLAPDREIEVREYRAGSVNVVDHDTFHRVDLTHGECWSLFLAGEQRQSWGFWNRHTDEFVDSRVTAARRT